MFKQSIFIVASFLIFMFVTLFLVSVHQSKNIRREPHALMDKYYRLKLTNPVAAQQTLLILLAQNNDYQPALKEVGFWSAHNPDVKKALHMSKNSDNNLSNHDEKLIQLAYLDGQKRGLAIDSSNWIGAPKALKQIGVPPNTRSHVSKSPADTMTNLGFFAIKHNHPYLAINYFKQVYALTYQPSLAMQLGYLYDQVDDKPAAYKAFKLAAKSHDKALALRAENAMTHLAGLQTKALPAPYFSEVFFNPFSQSRFGLTVRPLVVRLGVEQNNALHTKQYVIFRRTDDNKSENLGQISQIYEDNVQITGMGGQITPINGFPLIGFLEAGAAYDLVYRNRDRWRGDLRTGFMYYDEFCARPAYFDKLTWSTNYYSDLYGDVTYFTRYRNVIGGVKTHQGIRLLQYHSSMVNLYATGRLIEDTQRQFFNNFAEIGPGIEFIPTNRLNIRLRFEHVNGVYLPAGATPNPYSQYYINNLVQLLFYVKV